MAQITFKKGDDYALKLAKLAGRSEETAKKAIHAGAGVLADQVRKNLRQAVSGSSTGDLEASLGITPITLDKQGYWNAKIGFDGYDSRGVPNQLKARVLESGSSRQKKRPFVRPAVAKSKKKALEAMQRAIDEETRKTME